MAQQDMDYDAVLDWEESLDPAEEERIFKKLKAFKVIPEYEDELDEYMPLQFDSDEYFRTGEVREVMKIIKPSKKPETSQVCDTPQNNQDDDVIFIKEIGRKIPGPKRQTRIDEFFKPIRSNPTMMAIVFKEDRRDETVATCNQ